MKFTRSIIEEIIPLHNITSQEICSILNKIGLEVESFNALVAPKKVVVGKILECKKHPDATKLNICQVAIGGKEGEYEIRQIVCGAKNAKEGLFVAVALEGAVLPQVTIKKATLRGVESCGMLCSSSELGFPSINDGIIELDESIGELIIGKELSEYASFNDEVYEISITPNRGDCMSVYGIARELSVAFELELNRPKPKESENTPGIGRVLQVIAQDKKESSLAYLALENASANLPLKFLLLLGFNEVLSEGYLSNLSALCMLYTGVILNAYPQSFCQIRDKAEQERVVLTIKKDEKGFESVYNGNTKLSTIGLESNTQELNGSCGKDFIILEASYIPPHILAQRVLETKAKTNPKIFQRTSRGSNPDLKLGFDFLSEKVIDNANSLVYADWHDLIELPQTNPITVDILKASKVIGLKLERSQVATLLKRLEFKIEIPADETLLVATPPFFRHDITNYQDVIEEIIRFIGIDNVPNAPLSFIQGNKLNKAHNLYFKKREYAKKAIGAGFNEVIHFIFGSKEKFQKYGFSTLKEELELLNPITNDLNTLRPTMIVGLMEAALRNHNNGFNAVSLMEIGSVYDENRNESVKIAFLQSGFLKEERYPNAKGIKGEFYTFADRVSRVIGDFRLEENTSCNKDFFHLGQCAKVLREDKEVGIISKLHPKTSQELGLEDVFVCEITLDKLSYKNLEVKMHSKYQKTIRDLSILLDKNIPYYKLQQAILSLKIEEIVGSYPLDVYKEESLGDKISLTIRLELQSSHKTLEEKDIVEITNKVLECLKQDFKAELR
ncbi:phenylalanine--tRNA ligase subunit beta [Helicobacter valdiviensis]|uniref:Phenylalanine--tRNA ligase beta subunit n=1 Tax=Helicobacter valdiviensis TaxID=1458358 RepID=A0A2W6NIR5_9HELI|nr:phenylalanine--tRNA ligase subunit beta [Helicobacter valdiviensis]PZT48780.1 phenylalanine--tRNA ligase subunit beta [Helicobacter valdiviensis]